MKCRTIFYTSLGRLFMIDSGEDEDKFDKFMQPLTSKKYNSELCDSYYYFPASMDALSNMLVNNKSMFSQEETKVSYSL